MFIDTSAVVSIIMGEPGADRRIEHGAGIGRRSGVRIHDADLDRRQIRCAGSCECEHRGERRNNYFSYVRHARTPDPG